MLTVFGQALRKIRIDNQELLKDMADKLRVSSAYLSAIETGKRRIPSDFASKVSKLYNLTAEKTTELQSAADLSANEIKLNLTGGSQLMREATTVYAKAIDNLTDEDFAQIMKIVKGKKGKR